MAGPSLILILPILFACFFVFSYRTLFFLVCALIGTLPPFNRIIYHYYSNYWPPAAASKILAANSGIMSTGAIATAINLGIFNKLSQESLSCKELAQHLECSERGLEILLNMLVSIDILQMGWFTEKYELTRAAQLYLVSDRQLNSPGSDLSSFPRLYWDKSLVDHILDMENAVKHGGTTLETHAGTDKLPLWASFAEMTGNIAFGSGMRLSQYISNKKFFKADQKIQVLDLACGSGGYGYAVGSQYPNSTVTFMDYDNVLGTTKINSKSFGINEDQLDRFQFHPGNIFLDDFGAHDYDVTIAANIFQHFSVSDCIQLSNRIFQSSKPGSYLIIIDFVVSRSVPSLFENPMLRELSLLMLIFSKEGQARSCADWKQILTEGGWSLYEIYSNFPFPYNYIVGKKV